MENVPQINSDDLGPDFIKPEYKSTDYSNFETQKGPEAVEAGAPAVVDAAPENVVPTEQLPEGIVDTVKLAESLTEEDLKTIHGWYASAMDRRDREPTDFERFKHHFFDGGSWEPTYAMGDMDTGFVLGFYKHDIFIPTHFAPRTMKGGYAIFKRLAENVDLPVATAVTDDLAKTLLKMDGWHKLSIGFLAFFNAELKKKTVIYNSAEGIRTKIIGLAKEFWEETRKIKSQQEGSVA